MDPDNAEQAPVVREPCKAGGGVWLTHACRRMLWMRTRPGDCVGHPCVRMKVEVENADRLAAAVLWL